MSDDWIEYIAAEKLDGLGGLKEQTADAILNASDGVVQKYVAAIDKISGEINFLKLDNY